MSITEKLKLRLCEEVKFDSDGYSAMCRVIDEFAGALKPSHNTGSPKLPGWEAVEKEIKGAAVHLTGLEPNQPYMLGARAGYESVARQLRAGA